MGYFEDVKADVETWMEDNMDIMFDIENGNYSDIDEIREDMNDKMWIADSVTGNGSGSYFFNRYEAKEMVLDHIDEVREAFEDFGYAGEAFGNRVFNDEWEEIDVITRCYYLGQAIESVLDDMEDDIEEAFAALENEEEDEDEDGLYTESLDNIG